jgi:1-acyl-sn-glycerol-3-phosphate acyltransferase
VIATGICFGGFGVGGVILTLFVVPILHLMPGGKEAQRIRARYIIHKLFWLVMFVSHNMGILKFKIDGPVELLRSGHALVLANHPSYIDVVAILSQIPDADCVVKSEHWKNPVFGGAVRAAEYISNNSPEQVIESCAETVKEGGTLVIFPEGTRSILGEPMQFLRGAAHIALLSSGWIVPVVIRVEPPAWTKSHKWYQIPDQRICFTMSIGQLGTLTDWVEETRDSPIAARKLTEALKRYFEEKLENNEDYTS